ncbi:MAG TPA: ATP-binding protein [Byssovorax sp.]
MPSSAPPASSTCLAEGLRGEALRRTAQRLAAEEVAALYRHDLSGKLGAARMLMYTLKRRTVGEGSPLAGDARTSEAIELLEAALKGALGTLERQLFVDAPDEHDPFDATEVLLDVLRDGIASRRVRVSSRGPLWIDAAADDVAVAVLALVDNALAVSETVEVRLEEVGERARIEVVDDGPGLPEAADDATPFSTTTPGHLGVGLRVVRRVARRWSGRVEARREEGRTVVCLELPAIHVDAERDSHA